MTLVWETDLPPGEKLVLLALADQANDQGTQCWPSVETIAKRSGQNSRTVRRALASLETKGHLTRKHRDGTSNQYHVHPCHNVTPDKLSPLTKTTDTPDTVSPKPSRTIINKKETRAHKLPDDWSPVLTPASQRIVDGWPPGRLDQELQAFRDHAADKGRVSKDWQAAFRTWLTNSSKWNPANGNNFSKRGGNGPDKRSGLARAIDNQLAGQISAFP